MKRYFVTGIGTGIGKTIVSAMLAEVLGADYWKPVQAGNIDTDSDFVRKVISNKHSVVHPELYSLQMPASPHIAARNEGLHIDMGYIKENLPKTSNTLIIEGAGGLMVPLNDSEFVSDLIAALDATVILVSRNYLGSINHSLMTAMICRQKNLAVAGWIFNDQYLQYEDEIVAWSGYGKLASVPSLAEADPAALRSMSGKLRSQLNKAL
ncbi:MAG TPA: dethiobiotin synthase [Flavitalea sp.]|nr:dethiobiotin synthase [Flavitalea sp.]